MGDAHLPPDGKPTPDRTAVRIPPRWATDAEKPERDHATKLRWMERRAGTRNTVSVHALRDDIEQTLSVASGLRGADAVNDEQLVDRAGALGGNFAECAIAGHHVGRHP